MHSPIPLTLEPLRLIREITLKLARLLRKLATLRAVNIINMIRLARFTF
jgi:hypothetical protein